MATGIGSRIRQAWNIFINNDPLKLNSWGHYGINSSIRPDRARTGMTADRSIIGSIYTQLSIDAAAVGIKHVRLDENDQYLEEMDSSLTECLTVNPNLDQGPTQFRQDLAMTIYEKGVAAVVPIETSSDPNRNGTYDIYQLRVGTIQQWFPEHVTVSIYNQVSGQREDITLRKDTIGIIENPLYTVMNEPNSTLMRLIRKLQLLDVVDEQSSSGKLDIIIQLPYVIKSEARRAQAETRRKDIEMQLKGSQYGIAYTDGTERITQLNRPAENNLLSQVEYLTNKLYAELGMTPEIFAGTASEQTMLNYFNRMVEPLLSAITEEFNRKFLTKTARTQKQAIRFYRDPFKLIPINNIAEIADKFTRNEILSSNEIRSIISYPPSKDPKAGELRNSNISAPKEENPQNET